MGMGKKLDALLGRGFKTSKFKAMATMAISRLAVFKNQRQARCSIARIDVVEFLGAGNHERALLRVEQVIKEQNMLDVFVMLESYCTLLIERINLMAHEKVCPEELKEAVSGLIFASSRVGEFPELQEIRVIFASRFGKEFASRAVELRNNCGVNPKIIQKLSTRIPSLETKMKVLEEIASDNNIVLQIDLASTAENQDRISSSAPSGMSTPRQSRPIQLEDVEMSEDFSGSGKMRRKYRDVADAAQAAFESAAYAAAAARAAVELSRAQSTDPDDPTSPNNRPRKVPATIGRMNSELQTSEENMMQEDEMNNEVKFDTIHPLQNYDSKSIPGTVRVEKGGEETGLRRSLSNSSSDSADENLNRMRMSSEKDGRTKSLKREVAFDESDGENDPQGRKFQYSVHSPLRSSGLKMDLGTGASPAEPLDINRRPISVRTRWAHVR